MNKRVMSLSGAEVRILCALNDKPIWSDETGRNRVDAVLFLDPGGYIVAAHEEGVYAVWKHTVPAQLHGGFLCLYRIPIGVDIHVYKGDVEGFYYASDGAGTCGIIQSVGNQIKWREAVKFKRGRRFIPRFTEYIPEPCAPLHAVLKEADRYTISMRAHKEGFITFLDEVDIFVWTPLLERTLGEDESDMPDWFEEIKPLKDSAQTEPRKVFPKSHRVRRRPATKAGG